MDDFAALALKDRVCDATDRIPTSRYPLYATTLAADIAAGGLTTTLEFEAQRDTLLNELSLVVTNITGGAAAGGTLNVEYCNTVYVDNTDVEEWRNCCDQRPFFLVGVRENKKLRFDVTLDVVAPAGGVRVNVNIAGFQGNGCCP